MSGDTYLIKVTHGHFIHDIRISPDETVGAVKKLLVEETLVPHDEQRLLFRGREILDLEILREAGVKNGTKLMLLENLQVREAKLASKKPDLKQVKAIRAISAVHSNVDEHEKQLNEYMKAIKVGKPVRDKDLYILSELLMRELLKLDEITGEEEVKQDRRAAVKRVQTLVDKVDSLRSGGAKSSSETPGKSGPEPSKTQGEQKTPPPDKPSLNPGPDSIPAPQLSPDSIPLSQEFVLTRKISESSRSSWDPGMLFTNKSLPAQQSPSRSKNPFLPPETPPEWEKFDPEPSNFGVLTSIPSPKTPPAAVVAADVASDLVAPKTPTVARKKFSPRQLNSSPSQGSEPRSPSIGPKKQSPKVQESSKNLPHSAKKESSSLSTVSSSPSPKPSLVIADTISTFSPTSIPKAKSSSSFSPTSGKKGPRSFRKSSSLSPKESSKESSIYPDEVSTFPKTALPKPAIIAARISKLASEQRARSAALEASRKSKASENPPSENGLKVGLKVGEDPRNKEKKVEKQEENSVGRKDNNSVGVEKSVGSLVVPLDLISLDPPSYLNQPSLPAGSSFKLTSPVLTSVPTSSYPLSTNPFAGGDDRSGRGGQVSAVGLNPFEETKQSTVEPSWERF